MATNGNTGAIALICSLFTKSGDIVYAEEPTYFLAKSIFADFKLDCRKLACRPVARRAPASKGSARLVWAEFEPCARLC